MREVRVRAFVIINPVSGPRHRAGGLTRRLATAEATLRAHDVPFHIHVTRGPLDAHGAARDAAAVGADVVIAWGGDGTMNEVASALAGTGVPMGIVAAGSGNGLARELGVPARPDAAIVRALRAPPRRIDLGEIDGRVFVNLAGLGLDAVIARRFNALRGTSRGLATYVAATWREVRTFAPFACRIEIDGRASEHRATIVAFCNSAQYGNGARIAPVARVDDARLDLVVVEGGSWASTLWRARRLFDGTILRDRRVRHARVERATVTCATRPACHVDGEPAPIASSFCVRVRPGALLVKG